MTMNYDDIMTGPRGNGGFRVPDGYFDSLTDRVMARLPEQDAAPLKVTRRRWHAQRRAVLAAASVIAAVFSIGIVMHSGKGQGNAMQASAQTAAATETTTSKTIDQIATYSMMDNEDMYAYMSENY